MITNDSLNLLRRYIEYMQVQCDHAGSEYCDVKASTSVQELSDLLELAETIVNYKHAIGDARAILLTRGGSDMEDETGRDLYILDQSLQSVISDEPW